MILEELQTHPNTIPQQKDKLFPNSTLNYFLQKMVCMLGKHYSDKTPQSYIFLLSHNPLVPFLGKC